MSFRIITADVLDGLRSLDSESVQTCITSPPYYGLRNYGIEGQVGLEDSPDAYVARLVDVFREVRRVLANDGTLWLNLGDSYAAGKTGRADTDHRNGPLHAIGSRGGNSKKLIESTQGAKQRTVPCGIKPKDLIGIPWRVAFALQADGWYLRSEIIWHKPNPMPESVRDRPTKAHEQVFLLSKLPRYFYDADAVREPLKERSEHKSIRKSPRQWTPETFATRAFSGNMIRGEIPCNPKGRNRRSVWTITPKPVKLAHFAVMPEALAEPCILAGSKPGDLVLDPFAGSGTVGVVALRHKRNFIGCELNPKYTEMAMKRIADSIPQQARLAA